MSMSKERKSYVVGRLVHWGEAFGGGCGGPRLASAVLGSSGGEFGSRVLVSEAAEEVECCWRQLPDDERAVLRETYFHPDANVQQHCRALCWSRDRYYRILNRAIALVSAALHEVKVA